MNKQPKLNLRWGWLIGLISGLVTGILFVISEELRLYRILGLSQIHRFLEIVIVLGFYSSTFLVPAIITLRNQLRIYRIRTTYGRSLIFLLLAGYFHFVAFILFIMLWKERLPDLDDVGWFHLLFFGPNVVVAVVAAAFFRKGSIPETQEDVLDEMGEL